jgi:predicted acyltransferase
MNDPHPDAEFAQPSAKAGRLESLDVFRGLTVAGMILVNNPGSGAAFPPLRHADWDGWTPTDLVFPFFLLIVGVALPFSFAGRRAAGAGRFGLVAKVVRRSVVIFGIGLALNALGPLLSGDGRADWSRLRIPGVLQRIALCYLIAALIELFAGLRAKVGIAVALLVGYWLALSLIGIPGHTAGDLSRQGNLPAFVDRALLGTHIYRPGIYDPEGLLSTLPAVATTLLGILAGHWLRSGRSPFETDAGLFVAGWFGVLLGNVWGWVFPINKALWTSSYVLLSAGLGLQAFAVTYWLIDIVGIRKWSCPFAIFGKNAIAAFVLSGLIARFLGLVKWHDEAGRVVTAKGWAVETLLRPWLSPMGASLAYALIYVAVCYVPIYAMHRKGIFLKA